MLVFSLVGIAVSCGTFGGYLLRLPIVGDDGYRDCFARIYSESYLLHNRFNVIYRLICILEFITLNLENMRSSMATSSPFFSDVEFISLDE
jgi:hypothetical protein